MNGNRPNIKFNLDGSYMDQLSGEVRSLIISARAAPPEPEGRLRSAVSLCGFINASDGIHVFLPKTTDEGRPSNELRRYARILYGVLLRYSETRGSEDLQGQELVLSIDRKPLLEFSLQI